MTANYVLLNKITVGSGGASSVEFTGIPQTGYTDLVIKTSVRDTFNANALDHWIRFNGVTTNYTWRKAQGSGSATSSSSGTTDPFTVLGVGTGGASTANTFGNYEVYIPNYTSSNFKSINVDAVGENNATQAFQVFNAGLWSNTAAITSIQFIPQSGGGWAAGSTFYLYGVVNASTAATKRATGGDVIVTSGGYTYHTFKTSGTFTPTQALTCDVLVIAGGGGGSQGGGGAGGLAAYTAQSLTTTNYTVTVGAGGAGISNTAGNQTAFSGSNSTFQGLTAAVGGGGAGDGANGLNGGSGGGGGYGSPTKTGGTATSGQGNNGGSGGGFSDFRGGGGGGAGAAGGNSNGTSQAGNGGIGSTTYSSWGIATATGQNSGGTTYFAGGGGGGSITSGAGSGGLGGGGAGALRPNAGASGTANTGGGAGGAEAAGGNGGSGLIIVRYAV